MSGTSISARRAGGFTLVELMVTIAIMAILLMVAVPSFTEASLSGKLSSISNSFVSSTQLARSEAIKRNATVTLCASSNGVSCGGNWSAGWVVLAGGAPIYTQAALATGFVMSGGVTSIAFQPSGAGATPATLTVCRSSPTPGSQKRTISLSAAGRASVTKEAAGTCP